jgi:AbrB family looped-hinge helix DNA binding protein
MSCTKGTFSTPSYTKAGLAPGGTTTPNALIFLARRSFLAYNLTSKIAQTGGGMAEVATTKMSSKGQVVIPESIRKQLNLKTGSQFVVIGKDDVLILKTITEPDLDTFEALIAEARREAKRSGLRPSDIRKTILRARKRS